MQSLLGYGERVVVVYRVCSVYSVAILYYHKPVLTLTLTLTLYSPSYCLLLCLDNCSLLTNRSQQSYLISPDRERFSQFFPVFPFSPPPAHFLTSRFKVTLSPHWPVSPCSILYYSLLSLYLLTNT